DAKALERRRGPFDHHLHADTCELVRVALRGVRDLLRQLDHVVAAIAVLGRFLTAGAGADGLAEAQHLRADVVHVVLACGFVAGVSASPSRSAIGRGGWPSAGASSIAALVE